MLKIITLLFTISFVHANDQDQLRDMLSAKGMILRYEKMFQGMIDDDRLFNNQQMEQFKNLIDDHFGKTLLTNNFYKWKITKEDKILIFDGRLIDDGKTSIEIKKNKIYLKATFERSTKTIKTKRFVQVNIPIPRDCDESRVKFDRTSHSLIISFPVKTANPLKNKRVPLKKDQNGTTI